MNRPITLTTDFSICDPYIGAMKGAILSINPLASITDIAHQLRARDTLGAAFVLQESCPYFPPGTIHTAVIDPGVGGERAPIIIETENYIFVGPDNGIFSLALDGEEITGIVRITNKEYTRETISNSFHGRDIFAPIAAHLSLGVKPSLMGDKVDKLTDISLPAPIIEKERITGEIIHIDGFGNLITNIDDKSLKILGEEVKIELLGTTIIGVSKCYSDSDTTGSLCAIIGSAGLLEIAVNMADASKRLNAKVGEKVTVSL